MLRRRPRTNRGQVQHLPVKISPVEEPPVPAVVANTDKEKNLKRMPTPQTRLRLSSESNVCRYQAAQSL